MDPLQRNQVARLDLSSFKCAIVLCDEVRRPPPPLRRRRAARQLWTFQGSFGCAATRQG
jgi:hypothetical protein